MRRKFVKSLLNLLYKPFVMRYIAKERSYKWEDISIRVFPGVFHPGLFYSTKALLGVIQKEELKKKIFMELGAGSGLISIYAAKKGANVTATDINQKAIECIGFNAKISEVSLEIIRSDLFEQIPEKQFDYIVINPPYYKRQPTDEASFAWYAGLHYEYFVRLFNSLHAYINADSKVLMVLSEDAALDEIGKIAGNHSFKMIEVFRKRVMFEDLVVFRIPNLG
jgi:release factor glutamine methyltransferase